MLSEGVNLIALFAKGNARIVNLIIIFTRANFQDVKKRALLPTFLKRGWKDLLLNHSLSVVGNS